MQKSRSVSPDMTQKPVPLIVLDTAIAPLLCEVTAGNVAVGFMCTRSHKAELYKELLKDPFQVAAALHLQRAQEAI